MIDSTLFNANILLVDDQEANIEILEDLLEMQGYAHVQSTTDPRQVMHLFSEFMPDLILLDLMMSYLDGFEIMELLKNQMPEGSYVPILILTADISQETKQRALKKGANDFLTKPFDLTEVSLRIRNLLYTKYLHQQMEMQNLILEEKVKERTLELETTNQELSIARDKAESSDRLKTAFLQNISHEIRTPLNGILGFSDLLVDPDISTEEKASFIGLIQSSSNRLLNTIEDYVNMAMIVSGNMKVNEENISIDTIVMDVQNLFKEQAEAKGLMMDSDYPTDAGKIMLKTDPALFKRILFHLLDNAVKFTETGTITVGFCLRKKDVEFFIRDTGIGVDEKIKDSLFDIFVQENSSITRGHEGSGLGLSIVRGLLLLLGGTIRMESDKGQGSVFYFTLPLNK